MIERYNDAWNAHDLDAIVAFHAPGMVFENHTAGERAEGADVREHIRKIFVSWPDLSFPVRAGATRDELYVASMDQGLARDAAFVAIGAAEVDALDDRAYREAQLAAGLVEGRLHLLAYALGASACGMTFIDSEVPALLGEPLDGLLFTCVGVPEYRSATGGPPGSPTTATWC